MKQENMMLGHIPLWVLGKESRKGYLYVHGKMGQKEEALSFAPMAEKQGYQVIAPDLPGHGQRPREELLPRQGTEDIYQVYCWMKQRFDTVSLRATSIGAWLAMLALPKEEIDRALFVSPVIDMEGLISSLMQSAGVTEAALQSQGEITTDFGETLSWDYFTWVRQHPLHWHTPTHVLYGEKDALVPYESVKLFAEKENRTLTVMEDGEHWFHTASELSFLKRWEEKFLA